MTGYFKMDEVEVPAENLLGREGEGFKIAMFALDQGRYTVAAGATGLIRACRDASVKYARERETFGVEIGQHQLVKEMLARMEADYQQSRLLWLRSGWLKNIGRRNTKETSLAKWMATVASERAAGDAVQIHGANGYSDEYPVGRYYRNCKGAVIYEGHARDPRADAGRLPARLPHRQADALRAPAVPGPAGPRLRAGTAGVNRNLLAIAGACFIGFSGFTLVMPFLPLYFAQLGMRDAAEIALWSGLSLGVTPGMTALLAPLWGRVADRYGNKFLVLRSLVVLRDHDGAHGPGDPSLAHLRLAGAAGVLRRLRRAGGIDGRAGGAARSDGQRHRHGPDRPTARASARAGRLAACWRWPSASGRLVLRLVAVLPGGVRSRLALVRRTAQAARRRPVRRRAAQRLTFEGGAAFQQFVLLMGVIFGLQLVDRSFGPVLPLYLEQLGVPAGPHRARGRGAVLGVGRRRGRRQPASRSDCCIALAPRALLR